MQRALNINENDLPEKYQFIIRRLQMAMAEKEVSEIMVAEDDYIRDLIDMERAIQSKDTIIAEKDSAIAKKDSKLARLRELLKKEEKL